MSSIKFSKEMGYFVDKCRNSLLFLKSSLLIIYIPSFVTKMYIVQAFNNNIKLGDVA